MSQRGGRDFPAPMHQAAAVITFLSPGLRFFHQGQLEGRRKRISPHLCRGPDEPVDQELARFYERLLAVLRQPVGARRANGSCSRAGRPGTATGRRTVSLPLPGKAKRTSGS